MKYDIIFILAIFTFLIIVKCLIIRFIKGRGKYDYLKINKKD